MVRLSHGPIILVECFSSYKVDGIWFHIKTRNQGKATYNCSVYVKGIGEGDEAGGDYCYVLHEVLCLQFTSEPIQKLFFLIVSGSMQIYLRGCVILNLPSILRLIMPTATESLTHSYLLILQPNWCILNTSREYQKKTYW